MIFDNNNEKGRAGLSMAIAYFGSNGYTVSIPLNDTQDYDLIIDNGHAIQKVQVKATNRLSPSGSYACSVRNTSGTSRKVCSRVIESSADLLFCLCGDMTMYLIPVTDIKTKSEIYLMKNKSKKVNKDVLDTSKYIVSF